MADMMKSMGGAGSAGRWRKWRRLFGLGGGMPQPSPEEIAELQKKFGGGAGMGAGIPSACRPPGAFSRKPGLPGLPGLGGGKPSGLPGLGGLPSFNPFGKKK